MPAKVVPLPKTLEKYGLTEKDFLAILDSQGNVCPICGRVPNPSKRDGKIRFVIDHYHAKRYAKLPPKKRQAYVRGLVCWYDNRYFLSKGITAEKARNIITYLEEFERRKP